MKFQRNYSFFDQLCLGIDQAVRALTDNTQTTGANYPGNATEEAMLSEEERQHSASLMRVNHAGEICAQALYHGQAAIARTSDLKEKLQQAAIEEGDHLAWCRQRLDELGSHTSYLKPLWYGGSFCLGMLAGMIGDKWSLGFLAETERQVIQHLADHLEKLPNKDARSYKILQQMEKEEAKHRDEAIAAGAALLPTAIRKGMALTSKVMVRTAYWI
jgi:ubiquinone biosynthesis monooxygenase Coq7